ncbi:MAG: hypothetical protein AAF518_10115 [Spirochaetota bacterium]
MTRRKLRKLQKKESRKRAESDTFDKALPDFLPGDRVVARSESHPTGVERDLNGEILRVIKNENKPGYHYQVALSTGNNQRLETYLDSSKIHLNQELYTQENLRNRKRSMFMLYKPSFVPGPGI